MPIAGQQAAAVSQNRPCSGRKSVTGFYFLLGDGAADIIPLWRLNKRQGRAMLQVPGAPDHFILKLQQT